MGTIHRLVVCFACPALFAATVALGEDSHRWRHADLTGIRTYAFQEPQPAASASEKDLMCEPQLVQEETNAAIAVQLDRLGLKRSDDHPDVYVVARRKFEMRYTYYGPYDAEWSSSKRVSDGFKPACHSGWVRWEGW